MSFLDRIFGNDHQRAATRYAGQESATAQASRQRREGHRRSISRAAAQGQAWEDRDRQQDRRGSWYRAAR